MAHTLFGCFFVVVFFTINSALSCLVVKVSTTVKSTVNNNLLHVVCFISCKNSIYTM